MRQQNIGFGARYLVEQQSWRHEYADAVSLGEDVQYASLGSWIRMKERKQGDSIHTLAVVMQVAVAYKVPEWIHPYHTVTCVLFLQQSINFVT